MYSRFMNLVFYTYFIAINLKLLSFIMYRVFQKFNVLRNIKKEIIEKMFVDINSHFAATFISRKIYLFTKMQQTLQFYRQSL